MILITVYIWKC